MRRAQADCWRPIATTLRPQALAAAKAQAKAAGLKAEQVTGRDLAMPTAQILFKRLPEPDQIAILKEASPEELEVYRKLGKPKVRVQFPAVMSTPESICHSVADGNSRGLIPPRHLSYWARHAEK